MLCVVAPLLHKFLVLTLDVNVTLPPAQNGMEPLTVITGGCGTIFGRDVPLPAVRLVHPFTVCVTEYVALFVTVIAGVVAPLLHNTEPVTLFAVNTELPQLLTTDTVGAEGYGFGADTPLPGALIHPFAVVCVTVYVAEFVTVIEDAVDPLLHSNEPVKFEAVKTELAQLFVTITVGATGTSLGADTPLPFGLEHPFTV